MAKISGLKTINESKALAYILNIRSITLEMIDIILISDKDCGSLRKLIPNTYAEKIITIGHHESHLGNLLAFAPRDLDECDFTIFDGYGDGLSGIIGSYQNGGYEIKSKFSQKNSLGLIYTAATNHIGFGSFGNEGKLQGLASYGNYDQDYSIAKDICIDKLNIQISEELSSESDWKDQELYSDIVLGYNSFFARLIEKRFIDEELDFISHANFAYTLQRDIADAIANLIEHLSNLGKDNFTHQKRITYRWRYRTK